MQNYTLYGTTFVTNDSVVNLSELMDYTEDFSSEFPLSEFDAEDKLMELEDLIFDSLDKGSIFKVGGDAMKGAGIFDGDIAIVEKGKTPEIGDIVVANIDGKYSLRYLAQDDEGVFYLKSANKKCKPIYSSNLEIFGVVISVIRNLKH